MRKRCVVTIAASVIAGLAVPVGPAAAAPAPVGTLAADNFIVTFADSVQSRRITHPGVTELRETAEGSVVVRATSRTLGKAGASQLMRELAAQPGVVGVEPDLRMTAQFTPNDPRYAEQWDLFEAAGGINAPGAWDLSTGAGATVAVIDTGITPHSDLSGNVLPGYDFISDAATARDGDGRDPNPNDEGDWFNAGECGSPTPETSSWHGTHVAGTVAALTDNAVGVAGIARNAKILPVRVLGKCGGFTSDIADAITWASGGRVPRVPANPTPAKVINLSLGGSGACGTTFQRAITNAVSRGTTVVIAAGNSGADVAGFSPANCNNVVAVASNDRQGNRAFYSNFGTRVDVTAPGGEVRLETDPPGTRSTPQNGVLSTLNTGTTVQAAETYFTYMGTSMAAPHVAGLVALMLGKRPTLSPAQVEAALKANARPLPGSCTGGCGAGIIDATRTVGAV
jgi:serine protease